MGGSISWDFLFFRFGKAECLATYRGDFMDLEEHWIFYRCQAFIMAFFGSMLVLSQSGSINFSVLPLVSTLPHSTSFIPYLFSETIRSLSLCCETSSSRLGCCVHLLQLWFCSHLSVVSIAQPTRFLRKNRVKITWPLIFLSLGTLLVGCGICLAWVPLTGHGESSGELLGGRVGPIVLVCLASLLWASGVV